VHPVPAAEHQQGFYEYVLARFRLQKILEPHCLAERLLKHVFFREYPAAQGQLKPIVTNYAFMAFDLNAEDASGANNGKIYVAVLAWDIQILEHSKDIRQAFQFAPYVQFAAPAAVELSGLSLENPDERIEYRYKDYDKNQGADRGHERIRESHYQPDQHQGQHDQTRGQKIILSVILQQIPTIFSVNPGHISIENFGKRPLVIPEQ